MLLFLASALFACGPTAPVVDIDLDGQSYSIRSKIGVQWSSTITTHVCAYENDEMTERVMVSDFLGAGFEAVSVTTKFGLVEGAGTGQIDDVRLSNDPRQPMIASGSFEGSDEQGAPFSGTFEIAAADCDDPLIETGLRFCGGDIATGREDFDFVLDPSGSVTPETPAFQLLWSAEDAGELGYPATLDGDTLRFPSGVEIPCVNGPDEGGYTSSICLGDIEDQTVDGCTYRMQASASPGFWVSISSYASGADCPVNPINMTLTEYCHANPGACAP